MSIFDKIFSKTSDIGKSLRKKATTKVKLSKSIFEKTSDLFLPIKQGSLTNPVYAAQLARSSKTVEEFRDALGFSEMHIVRNQVQEDIFEKAATKLSIDTEMSGLDIIPLGYASGGIGVMRTHQTAHAFQNAAVDFIASKETGVDFLEKARKRGEKLLSNIDEEDLFKTMVYHEFLEKEMFTALRTSGRETETAALNSKIFRIFGHYGSEVLAGEGAFVREYGNENLRKFIQTARSRTFFDKGSELKYWRTGFLGVGTTPAADKNVSSEILNKLNRPFNPISGSDDTYNTIEGLPHSGMAGATRKKNTRFGSGYQGEKQKEDSNYLYTASVGIGTAGLFYQRVLPKTLNYVDPNIYPKLAEMQKRGKKYGLIVLSQQLDTTLYKSSFTKSGINKEKIQFGSHVLSMKDFEANPKKFKKFKGLFYNFDVSGDPSDPMSSYMREDLESIFPPKSRHLNMGQDLNKWDFYKHMEKRGFGNYQPETMNMVDFLEDKETRRAFLERHGGTSGIIVKKSESSLSRGVFLDYENIPKDVWSSIKEETPDFLVQEKLKLQGEFRVITVGGKAIYSAHRFATPSALSVLDSLGKVSPELKNKILKKRLLDTVLPVSSDIKPSLESFAEMIAKEIPMDVAAFDIGMVGRNEYKIIEMQKTFGTISNPVVNRRLSNVLTKGSFSKEIAQIAGVIGVGVALAYNAFSGSDDEYNTIEGLSHKGLSSSLRKIYTHFGSGMDRLRILAKDAGLSFEELVGKRSFQHALSKAKDTGYLGGGGFGSLRKKEGIWKGNEFEFAEKRFHFKNFSGPDEIAQEANIMKLFGAEPGIPSLYGHGDDFIRMEIVPGEIMRKTIEKGVVVTEEAKKELFETIDVMGKAGYVHQDPNPGNILYDPTGKGRLFMVDFGLVYKHKPGLTSQRVLNEHIEGLKFEVEALTEPPGLWRRRAAQQAMASVPPNSAGSTQSSNSAISPISGVDESYRKIDGLSSSPSLAQLKRRDYKSGWVEGLRSFASSSKKVSSRKLVTINTGFNSFDGMVHGGMAANLRKKRTDFGSKFDSLRKLAETSKQSYESFIRSGTVKEALAKGVWKEELGRGSFGVVDRMETTILGQKVSFARKTIHEEMKNIDFGGGTIGEGFLQRSQRSLDLRYEASVMNKLRNTEFAPSVYGKTSKHEMFMEFMENEALPDVGYIKNGAEKLKIMGETVGAAKIANQDVHLGNIRYNRENKSFVWVDWGMSTKLDSVMEPTSSYLKMTEKLQKIGEELSSKTPFAEMAAELSVSKTPNRIVQEAKGGLSKTPVAKGKQKHIGLAETPLVQDPTAFFKTSLQLPKDQKKVWKAGIRGGREHTGKAGKIVR